MKKFFLIYTCLIFAGCATIFVPPEKICSNLEDGYYEVVLCGEAGITFKYKIEHAGPGMIRVYGYASTKDLKEISEINITVLTADKNYIAKYYRTALLKPRYAMESIPFAFEIPDFLNKMKYISFIAVAVI